MPIYEYQCDGCNAVFEVFQKVSEAPPASHICGSTQVHRILSNTSFVLKGTGWYATDYADKTKKTDEQNGKGGKKHDGQAAGEAKGDSKPGAASAPADKAKTGGDKPSGGGSAKM